MEPPCLLVSQGLRLLAVPLRCPDDTLLNRPDVQRQASCMCYMSTVMQGVYGCPDL